MSPDYDVIVVGAGPVGAALARLLVLPRPGEIPRVALLDARMPAARSSRSGVDLRGAAISRASQRVLQAAGAWAGVAARRLSPYREMRVWDATTSAWSAAALHFDSAELGEPDLGHIVEVDLIRAALLEVLASDATVEFIAPVSVAALETAGDIAAVGLADGGRLTARLVVGADGAHSRIRELAGIEVRGWDYQQTAVVTHISTEKPHRETAWQRFLPTGPLAFLPLADGRCSIVWSTTTEQAEALLETPEEDFHAAVSEASDCVLGQVTGSAERLCFPLRLQHAQRYTQKRVALVGDAAHTVHPLAGQGLNLGLLDAAALSEVILDAVAAGMDPGDVRVLRRYERWRKGENLAAMAAFDGLHRLFGTGAGPFQRLRTLGLAMVGRLGPVRNGLVRRAMGLAGDLPRVALDSRPDHG